MPEFDDFEQNLKRPDKSTGAVLSHAFENYKDVLMLSVLATLILFAVGMLMGTIFGGKGVDPDDLKGIDPTDYMALIKASGGYSQLIPSLLVGVLLAPLNVGYIYICHKNYTGQKASFNDLFVGFKNNTANIIVFALIANVIQAVTLMMCIVPAIFIMPLFFLSYPILLFEKASFSEAMSKSINIAKQNYGTFVGMGILGILIAIAGVIVCGIGIVFTLGFFYAVMYSAYLAFVGMPKEVPVGTV